MKPKLWPNLLSALCSFGLLVTYCAAGESEAQTAERDSDAAERGYRFLVDKAYLPHDFDEETFEQLWKTWPEPLRSKAARSSNKERRAMAFRRYGLTQRPDNPSLPMQYVVQDGKWTMNCLACHGGEVGGKPYPGMPNNRYALETLTADVRKTKLRLGKPLSHMDIGSMFMPLGRTNGTSNAVMFGVALMAYRDADLNIHVNNVPGPMKHHDMDAPPWWHFSQRDHIYIDGFAEKGVRGLMQFILVKENGPEDFKRWEKDFSDIFAFIESLEPPHYPYPIDQELASRGKIAFNEHCSECHGTYGEEKDYPAAVIPIDEIGTDRVRFDALTPKHRAAYGKSWFGEHGRQSTVETPVGYLAPPLEGVWASAPYLHNGSVPTLWHLLHPDQRPVIWTRTDAEHNQDKVGLNVRELDKLPSGIRRLDELRKFFNTKRSGKSASGHDYPNRLKADEKRAVLEYLKTL